MLPGVDPMGVDGKQGSREAKRHRFIELSKDRGQWRVLERESIVMLRDPDRASRAPHILLPGNLSNFRQIKLRKTVIL